MTTNRYQHFSQKLDSLCYRMAAVFMVEALVLVGVFAYLFERWEVSRLGWGWFVFLSLLGSMAFAIPVVLLFPRRDGREQPSA